MTDSEKLRVVSVDRIDGSLVIGFSDGRCGRYGEEFLHSLLAQVEELFEDAGAGLDEDGYLDEAS